MLETMTDQLAIFGNVALAGLFGGVIGLERELARKPAGLRTHIFIAAGAALLLSLGEIAVQTFSEEPYAQLVRADPIRLIHAIIVGISFLGAGTIITHERKARIEGLTTAASMLLVMAIGLATALGQWVLAGATTLLAVAILVGMRFVEKKLHDQEG
jgi:putative Mg2+ transporter-C (MgtC) family protein